MVPPLAPAPFDSAEAAWFWTCTALMARRDPALRAPPGPCRPEDVVKCLDDLYRRRRVELLHARILRLWGERNMAPNPARPRERCDWRLWREALDRLEWPLRLRGIVAGVGLGGAPAEDFAGMPGAPGFADVEAPIRALAR